MNHDLALAIFRSLAVAGPPEKKLRRLKSFSNRDWQRTFPWLDESGLALELLNVLDRANARGILPPAIEKDLSVRLANNRQRLAAMRGEFDLINCAFEGAAVEYAVLKGFSVVPAYTPDPSLRSQHDYDYLVHTSSVETARQVLRAAGFHEKAQRPGLDPSDTIEFTGGLSGCSASGEEWYSARIPRRVELHLSLWQYDRDGISLQTPKDALSRKRYASWEGLRFPVLAGNDALLFHCLHAFHHILDYWCRTSCFLEIARFLAGRASDREFWDGFRSVVNVAGNLPDIVGLVFRLASELFEAPIPQGFGLAGGNRRSRALDVWVRRFGIEWALARYPGSKLSLLLHQEFVENPWAWREIRRRRLLPFHGLDRAAEPLEPNMKSKWRAERQQWRFAIARVRHHLMGLATYARHAPGWQRMLRRRGVGTAWRPGSVATPGSRTASSRKKSHGLTHSEESRAGRPTAPVFSVRDRVPDADCLLPTEKGPAQ